jgi:hypothetical protein
MANVIVAMLGGVEGAASAIRHKQRSTNYLARRGVLLKLRAVRSRWSGKKAFGVADGGIFGIRKR